MPGNSEGLADAERFAGVVKEAMQATFLLSNDCLMGVEGS